MRGQHPMPLLMVWIVALAGLVAGDLRAQGDYVVGYFDFRDGRSQTTGLGTALAAVKGLRAQAIRLDDPSTWTFDAFDMLAFGSFAELDERWNDFAGRNKATIEEFVRTGGVLVLFDRYRWADEGTAALPKRIDLLPRGHQVKRGKDDPGELWVSETQDPLWKGFRGPTRPGGWHQLPNTAVGAQKKVFLDAFEEWSPQFRRSATDEPRDRGGPAAALVASYGKGRIRLFQLALDKVDGIRDAATREAGMTLVRRLVEVSRQEPGPRPRTALPVATDPRPDRPVPIEPKPIEPKPPVRPEPAPVAENLLVRGSVFIDSNGDGRRGGNEPPLAGVRVGDEKTSVLTDTGGEYRLEIDRESRRGISVEVPSGTAALSPWFRRMGEERSPWEIDFALTPGPVTEHPPRMLVFALPAGLELPGALETLEARLREVLLAENPELVLVLEGERRGTESAAQAFRLQRLLDGLGRPWRFVAAAARSGASRREDGRDFGPDRFSFWLGRCRFLAVAPAADTGSDLDWLKAVSTTGAEGQDETVLVLGRALPHEDEDRLVVEGLTLILGPSAAGPSNHLRPFLIVGEPDLAAKTPSFTVLESGPEGLLGRPWPKTDADLDPSTGPPTLEPTPADDRGATRRRHPLVGGSLTKVLEGLESR